jgi:hypothetical protein
MPECSCSTWVPDEKTFKKSVQSAIEAGNKGFFEEQAKLGGDRIGAIVLTQIGRRSLILYIIEKEQIEICLYLMENESWSSNRILRKHIEHVSADILKLARDQDSVQKDASFELRAEKVFEQLKIKPRMLSAMDRGSDADYEEDDDLAFKKGKVKEGCIIS